MIKRRVLIAAPFILTAHLHLWPNGYIIPGLIADMIGVTIIYNPFRTRHATRTASRDAHVTRHKS